eukprot:3123405-Amphidinium_carterae.2
MSRLMVESESLLTSSLSYTSGLSTGSGTDVGSTSIGPGAIVGMLSVDAEVAIVANDCLAVARGLIVEPK